MEQKRAFPKLKLVYLVIIFVAIGILIGSFVTNVFFGPFIKTLQETFLNFALSQAGKIAYIAEYSVDQIVKNSQEIAFSLGMVDKKSKETDLILSRFLKENPEIREVSVIDFNGQEIKKMSVSRFFSPADLKNLFSSEEFIRASSGETFISTVFISEKAEPYLIIAVPIISWDQRKIIGVLRLESRLQRLWEIIRGMEIGKTGRISVVDAEGNLIADSDPSRVLKTVNLIGLPPVVAAIQGKEFRDLENGRYFNEKGEEVIGVASPIEKLGWGVIVEQDVSEVLGPGKTLRRFFILLILGSIIVICVLFWLVVLISRAVKELEKKYSQLESQKSELYEATKMLVRRDFKLSEVQEKRELELKKLTESRIALMNILEDIEEARKRAEEEKNKTLAVITNFADGILVFDKEDKLSLINPQSEVFFGVKAKDIIGKSISELSSFSILKLLVDLLGGHLATGPKIKKIFRKELRLGKDLILEVSTVFVRREGEKLGSLVILHDVTREKRVEEMKTEFVSLAAHQLRTPLSAIKWTLRMLLDGDLGEITKEQREFIDKTYRSNERMIGLINDLLNVTRIEEGRYLYKPVLANLEPVVQSVINSYQEELERRKIKLEFRKPERKLPEVLIDVGNMEIAIQGLLGNAIRYTRPGGLVTVSLNCSEKEIEVSIKDTGIGIPKDDQKRIFSKFFRAINAIRVETEGSGLGLYITKNIIEAHGGKIWFESEENKGTTFYFTVPIKKT